ISFAKGADQPELVGRVAPTGNHPDTMYYNANQDRIIVVEREYRDESGQADYASEQSRVLIYDVSDAANPKIAQELAFKGNAADTRLVGDILYVAASYSSGNARSPIFPLRGRSVSN